LARMINGEALNTRVTATGRLRPSPLQHPGMG
jgi:hypothetical protein